MAQPSVKTVQFTDPRIEPQPDPVYDYVIAPTQNQFYKIAASSKSNSSITFNNLTTLGVDRAYLDTFELELTATFTFNVHYEGFNPEAPGNPATWVMCPAPDEWTFDSFPFNKCCEEAHVNINGGAFFSQPLSYIRAKEHYMSQEALAKSYENVCPVFRPVGQTESGETYSRKINPSKRHNAFIPRWTDVTYTAGPPASVTVANYDTPDRPTRYGAGMHGYMRSQTGFDGGFNNSVVQLSGPYTRNGGTVYGDINYHFGDASSDANPTPTVTQITVTWREPIFCSPFSSRYDADYGRPLYNITSLDMTFTMQNLGNMIRLMHFHNPGIYVTDYNVEINSAMLCYQVMTIPPILKKPLTTLVPYRRFVPYITDVGRNGVQTVAETSANIVPAGTDNVTISSGVYTFNEVPNAIWIFCAPNKACLQQNAMDQFEDTSGLPGTPDTDAANCLLHGNWDTNKQFAFLKKVDISLANTTQILTTAKIQDLYRIAKANGCEDSYVSWSGLKVLDPRINNTHVTSRAVDAGPVAASITSYTPGCGSVLRVKPGVDLIVPDQALIAGANANNMVFQVNATFDIPPHPASQNNYALWLLFEYIGVAAISPGQCEITMNPLGSGAIMASSPVVSGSSSYNDSGLQGGAGFWDKLVGAFEKAQHIASNTGIISKILKMIPGERATKAAEIAEALGYGEKGAKRCRGGAVMGKGLQDWAI